MIHRLAQVPEQHPGPTIGSIGLLFAVAYAVGLALLPKPDGRIVVGDAVHYYVYLRSAVFDRDLHFKNDYLGLYRFRDGGVSVEWLQTPTTTGHVRNMMSVGPAIAWAPAFLATCLMIGVARLFGSSYPLDGFERAFQASAGFSGIAAATLGVWLTYLLSASLFSTRAAIWATLAVWLGSSAIYYSVISPTYSHATSMLVVSGFFLYWARTRDTQTVLRYAKLGVLGGLVALVRWQDAVFLLVPAVDAAYQTWIIRRATWRQSALNMTACLCTAVLSFSPQMWVWMILYGQPFAMPQGRDWMQWGSPHFLDVLFSRLHGLVSWTPIAGLAVAGFSQVWRRDRLVGLVCCATFAASLYANASVPDWWAGEAYGARRFVSCFPLFVLGTAALADKVRSPNRVLVLSVLFIGLNLLLLAQYQAFMHGVRSGLPYPQSVFAAPIDLARYLWSR